MATITNASVSFALDSASDEDREVLEDIFHEALSTRIAVEALVSPKSAAQVRSEQEVLAFWEATQLLGVRKRMRRMRESELEKLFGEFADA